MKKFLFPAAVLAAALFLPACDCKEDEKELADLVVTAADFAEDVSNEEYNAGDVVDAIVRIFNLLSGDCTKDAEESKHTVQVYRRDPATNAVYDAGTASYDVPLLRPDEGYDDQPPIEFEVPGEYYFRDIADSGGAVNERNENNNTGVSGQEACVGCRQTGAPRTITVQSTPEFEARVQRGERIPFVSFPPHPNLRSVELKYYQ